MTHAAAILLYIVTLMFYTTADDFLTYPTNIESIKGHLKTERPMIGILSMFVIGKKIIDQVPSAKGCSYIAGSFVSFVEGAGARAVPIPENLSDQQVDKILKSINGAILPGGDTFMLDAGYARILKRILQYSINQKKKGITWPILGEFFHPHFTASRLALGLVFYCI